MKVNEIMEKEIDDLSAEGNKILSKALTLGDDMKGQDLSNVSSWVTRLGQLIRQLYGTKSQQFAVYSSALETHAFWTIHSNYHDQISQLVGVATSIKHDYEKGLLNNIRSLIQADIFSDFLEMGEYLLSEGYKDAAAVIIGAVLEDGLKKLCERNGIPILRENGRPLTIEPLNRALSTAKVYNKLIQKQITTWAHIRNKAAHGEYDEYNKPQVEMMLIFVQNFTSDYLT
ncbi:MAG: hypothetical protein H8E80_04805 [Desulfobacteraceae bacterium]|uniref:DUF4145 domain-containing protein n=1 Tax=Candidatus Desulfaltia bathyphila TaxID=2841697 RepID=A0A8J6TA41_9BACT|nr:hypothetical protein [Candidatus Desulfaltia bathyphila]